MLAKAEPLDFIQDLIEILENKQADLDTDRLLEEILDMAACKAAIKAGQKLTASEIEQFLLIRKVWIVPAAARTEDRLRLNFR